MQQRVGNVLWKNTKIKTKTLAEKEIKKTHRETHTQIVWISDMRLV